MDKLTFINVTEIVACFPTFLLKWDLKENIILLVIDFSIFNRSNIYCKTYLCIFLYMSMKLASNPWLFEVSNTIGLIVTEEDIRISSLKKNSITRPWKSPCLLIYTTMNIVVQPKSHNRMAIKKMGRPLMIDLIFVRTVVKNCLSVTARSWCSIYFESPSGYSAWEIWK